MNPLSIARWRAVRLSSRNLRLNVAVKIDDSRQVAVCKANFHEELTESLEFTSAYLSSSILTMFAFPDRTADARIQLPYLGEERSIINVITSLNSHTIRTKRNENNSFPSLTYQIDWRKLQNWWVPHRWSRSLLSLRFQGQKDHSVNGKRVRFWFKLSEQVDKYGKKTIRSIFLRLKIDSTNFDNHSHYRQHLCWRLSTEEYPPHLRSFPSSQASKQWKSAGVTSNCSIHL